MRRWSHCLRIISVCIAIGLSAGHTARPAAALEEKDAATFLVTEIRRMNAIYELDSAMRELMWHQSMSILASYGSYNSYEAAGKTANADDLTRLKNRIGWNQESLGGFRRALRRDRDLPPDEAARAQSIVDSYSAFIDAARAVVAHPDDGDPGAANLAYQDGSVPLSKDIGADLYTLRRAARDRVAEIEKSLR